MADEEQQGNGVYERSIMDIPYYTEFDSGNPDSTETSGTQYMERYHKSTNKELIEKLISPDGYVESEHLVYGNPVSTDKSSVDKKTDKDDTLKKSLQSAFEFSKTTMNNMMINSMIDLPETALKNRFNRFSRYGSIDPTHEFVSGTREYLFFSKPDLHLFENKNPDKMNEELKYNPFFREAFEHYRYTFLSLQQSYDKQSPIFDSNFNLSNKYVPLLSNMVTSTLDLPDISASDYQTNQNLYQIGTSYREGSISSDLQYDFTLEFKDTKYMDVYMYFKIFDEYFRYKYEEELTPTQRAYIINRIIPEAISIWKIIVDDTDRIIYWAKAVACMPMSVPRGSISNIENQIKFSVNWKAQFIKDMDPFNLMELNNLTKCSLGPTSFKADNNINRKDIKFDSAIARNNWEAFPYILSDKDYGGRSNSKLFKRSGDTTSSSFYRLVWLKY
jgi:hypothetical protein